jgi:hypothetical protein
MPYSECPPGTGTWTEDQRFRCCIEDPNVGYKNIILTASKEECANRFGNPEQYYEGYWADECFGIPISCPHFTLAIGGMIAGAVVLLALLWRDKKKRLF